MTEETGYIKFSSQWVKDDPVDSCLIEELNQYRTKLYHLGLIGKYPNGIGFGNMSIRLENNQFLITGTATGHLPTLSNDHFTRVTAYNFKKNSLTCRGPIQASSESLTHAAIYEASPETDAVIHVHNLALWNLLKTKVPTSSAAVEYGTPEMALEINRLFRETDVRMKQLLVMAGHVEGIISFGKTVKDAYHLIINHIN